MKRKLSTKSSTKKTIKKRKIKPVLANTPSSYGKSQIIEVKSLDRYLAGGVQSVSIENVVGATNFATGMTFINVPQTGTSNYQRVGSKIKIKNFTLDLDVYNILPTGTNPPTNNDINNVNSSARLVIVTDTNPNGAYPAIADIFQDYDTTGAIALTGETWAGLNINNSKRFRVLFDKRLDFDFQKLGEHVHIFKNMQNMDTSFKANNGDIRDITTGGIYILFFGDASVGWAKFKSRIRYFD